MERKWEVLPDARDRQIADMQAEIEILKETMEVKDRRIERFRKQIISWENANSKKLTEIERLQAQIDALTLDALMLEFCPDEMTPEQTERWGKNQVALNTEGKEDKT